MTGDAWDTDLGRWALAWRDYLRGEPTADGCGVCDPWGNPCRREIGHANAHQSSAYIFRLDPGEMWGPDGGAIPVPPVASEVSVGAESIVEDADAAFAREIALAREAADPKGLLPWLASLPDDGDGTVGSDAKYQQMLAEEACDEQIAADAATAFVPDVPLPFGGEVKSD